MVNLLSSKAVSASTKACWVWFVIQENQACWLYSLVKHRTQQLNQVLMSIDGNQSDDLQGHKTVQLYSKYRIDDAQNFFVVNIGMPQRSETASSYNFFEALTVKP